MPSECKGVCVKTIFARLLGLAGLFVGAPGHAQETRNYTYDALGRVTAVKYLEDLPAEPTRGISTMRRVIAPTSRCLVRRTEAPGATIRGAELLQVVPATSLCRSMASR